MVTVYEGVLTLQILTALARTGPDWNYTLWTYLTLDGIRMIGLT